MLPPYLVLQKEIGQTPLQALDAWRNINPSFKDTPLTYAGRLDPMASGKLLVLVGDECKKQAKYHGLDKEYEVEVLLGVGTDTGDVLGLPFYAGKERSTGRVADTLAAETGVKNVPYPAFSSKTVHAKPLFQYALEGTLESIEIPVHTEVLYRIKNEGCAFVRTDKLQHRVESLLALAPRAPEPSKVLGADFRQDQIREAWEILFKEIPDKEFLVLTLRVTCASGTYMRTLAERIGRRLGTRGMALSIRRTRIGRYHNAPFFGFWSQRY